MVFSHYFLLLSIVTMHMTDFGSGDNTDKKNLFIFNIFFYLNITKCMSFFRNSMAKVSHGPSADNKKKNEKPEAHNIVLCFFSLFLSLRWCCCCLVVVVLVVVSEWIAEHFYFLFFSLWFCGAFVAWWRWKTRVCARAETSKPADRDIARSNGRPKSRVLYAVNN